MKKLLVGFVALIMVIFCGVASCNWHHITVNTKEVVVETEDNKSGDITFETCEDFTQWKREMALEWLKREFEPKKR